MESTYKLEAFCSNCDFRGEVNIPKGTTVENYPCEACGNTTLGKVHGPVRFIPDIPDFR